MSTYTGRHGPNVSQFLRDLNTISPQDTTADDTFNMEDDLALFTNTQFFDFDSGQNLDYQVQPSSGKGEADTAARSSRSASGDVAAPTMGEMPAMDFIPGDFSFNEFNNAYAATPLNPFPEGAPNYPPLQPSQASVQTPQQFQQNGILQGDKRKSDAMSVTGGPQGSVEETSRLAAEEDKRRRNTAASARFRIKKKQREQALEKSAKEMTDKISALETKVSQLETENKWLKNLLVEKNEGNEDITSMWKDFMKHATAKIKGAPEESRAESVKPER